MNHDAEQTFALLSAHMPASAALAVMTGAHEHGTVQVVAAGALAELRIAPARWTGSYDSAQWRVTRCTRA